MTKSISRYFFSMLLLLAVSATKANAQQNTEPTPIDTAKLYNGLLIGTDIWNPIGGALGNAYTSYELDLEAGIKGRYFPLLELGVSKSEITDDFGSTFSSKMSPYGRIGINYAIARSAGSLAYIGARIGYSKFRYDISGMQINNSYWNENLSKILPNEKSHALWNELVGGLRVNMTKHLYMGWSVRVKFRSKVKETAYSTPAYIPGYGKNVKTTYGIQYTVYYKF